MAGRAAILFDLDNTLVATRRADARTCRKLISILTEQYGVSQEEAQISTSTFLQNFRTCPDNPEYDLDTWRTHLWSEALGDEYCHFANDLYAQWLELRYHYLAISPEVLSLLLSLREHYLLGLITNGPSRAQWEKIERLQLRDYFDCILVSGDLPWEKPDQKIFQEACQHLNVEPKNCIMVGDKLETDIQKTYNSQCLTSNHSQTAMDANLWMGGIEAELGGTVWIPLSSSDTLDDDSNVTPDFTIDNVIRLPDVLPANPFAFGDHSFVHEKRENANAVFPSVFGKHHECS